MPVVFFLGNILKLVLLYGVLMVHHLSVNLALDIICRLTDLVRYIYIRMLRCTIHASLISIWPLKTWIWPSNDTCSKTLRRSGRWPQCQMYSISPHSTPTLSNSFQWALMGKVSKTLSIYSFFQSVYHIFFPLLRKGYKNSLTNR